MLRPVLRQSAGTLASWGRAGPGFGFLGASGGGQWGGAEVGAGCSFGL